MFQGTSPTPHRGGSDRPPWDVSSRIAAFTLVEMLVSLAVVAMLLIVLLSMTNQVTTLWRSTSGKIDQIQKGRGAFESITRRLGKATLNTYLDYDNPLAPAAYVRQSELRFLSGPMAELAGTAPAGKTWLGHGLFFQAPLGASEPGTANSAGLQSLLNMFGYFIEFGDDLAYRPGIITPALLAPQYRFRLCELIEPTNALSIYRHTSGLDQNKKPLSASYTGRQWFTDPLKKSGADRPVHVLAENVIALVILPRLTPDQDPGGVALSPGYLYDSTVEKSDARLNSRNQLPPVVQVTMVVIDDTSARRLHENATMPDLGLSALFQEPARFKEDLQTLEGTLISRRIGYRVFSTNVQIQGAKWSTEPQS